MYLAGLLLVGQPTLKKCLVFLANFQQNKQQQKTKNRTKHKYFKLFIKRFIFYLHVAVLAYTVLF